MPFRLVATIFLVGLCYIFVRVATLGHNFDKPIEGWFKNLVIGSAYKYLSALVILVCGIRSTKTELTDFDYSYYLGKNYKETTVIPKYVSTYVSNHTAWVDILMLLSFYRPAFAAKQSLKKVTFFGTLVQALGCILIARGGTQEERD